MQKEETVSGIKKTYNSDGKLKSEVLCELPLAKEPKAS